jgi:Autotransporter beta-domain
MRLQPSTPDGHPFACLTPWRAMLHTAASVLACAATASEAFAGSSFCLVPQTATNVLDPRNGVSALTTALKRIPLPNGREYYILDPNITAANGQLSYTSTTITAPTNINTTAQLIVALKDPTSQFSVNYPTTTPMATDTVSATSGVGTLSAGGSGPPALASIETSNSQAEELIRQRREQSQAAPIVVAAVEPVAQPIQADPVQAAQPNAAPALTQSAPIQSKSPNSSKSAPPVGSKSAPMAASATSSAKPAAITQPAQAPISKPLPTQPTPAQAQAQSPDTTAADAASKVASKTGPTSSSSAPANNSTAYGNASASLTVPKRKQNPRIAAAMKPSQSPPKDEDADGPLVQQKFGPVVGAWAQVYADFERHANILPGSADNTTRTQKTTGQVAGTDLTYRRSSNGFPETLQIGVLGGHNDTNSRFKDTANTSGASQRDEGGYLGGYAVYQVNRFSLEAMFKADFFQHSSSAVTAKAFTCAGNQLLVAESAADLVQYSVRTGSVEQQNYTTSVNAAYRFDLGSRVYLEPTVGVRYTYSNYGSGAADLNLQNGDILRLQAGARLGTSWQHDGYNWSASLLGLVYNDVMIRGYSLNPDGLPSSVLYVDQGKFRALGQLSTKVDVGRGLSYNAQADVRGGQDVVGVGGRVGARYEW